MSGGEELCYHVSRTTMICYYLKVGQKLTCGRGQGRFNRSCGVVIHRGELSWPLWWWQQSTVLLNHGFCSCHVCWMIWSVTPLYLREAPNNVATSHLSKWVNVLHIWLEHFPCKKCEITHINSPTFYVIKFNIHIFTEKKKFNIHILLVYLSKASILLVGVKNQLAGPVWDSLESLSWGVEKQMW